MFAKNELVFTSWGKILASFGKDLCRVFSGWKTVSTFDGAYSNQFITKKLAQSFGISKVIAKKSFFSFISNEIVNRGSYVSDR